MANITQKDEYLGVREITAAYPISHATIWRQLKLGNFPPSIRVGNRHLWRRADIEVYFTPRPRTGNAA